MLKAKELVGQERVRIVTAAFAGTGVIGRPGEVWRISAGVPMPQAVAQNSEPHDGPIPYDAVQHDQAAHEVYVKLNTPRREPVREEPWSEADIKANLGLTEAQLRAARASGFPQSTEYEIKLDADGIPYEKILKWRPDVVRAWHEQMKALVGR